MKIYDILFEMLRAGMFSGAVSEETAEALKNESVRKNLFKAAKNHDIEHLLATAVGKSKALADDVELTAKISKSQFMAVYRYENQNYELDGICRTLEEAKLPFILLKGSVLRRYYPEPWMRTSCDIDVLVKEEDVEKAKSILEEKLRYVFEGKTSHDYQLVSPGNVHLELHYTLLGSDSVNEKADSVLEDVWENTVPLDGFTYGLKMNDDMFLYYHIVHLAKHIRYGGCGIKPFLDLFVLQSSKPIDLENNPLLKKGGLEKTAQVSLKIADIYFGQGEHDGQTADLSEFILSGGVYGTTENLVAMHRSMEGGKFRYFLSRVFVPYDVLKYRYPVLEEKKYLFVPYQFRRWFDIVFKGSLGSSLNELRINGNTSAEKVDSAEKIWRDLGL